MIVDTFIRLKDRHKFFEKLTQCVGSSNELLARELEVWRVSMIRSWILTKETIEQEEIADVLSAVGELADQNEMLTKWCG